MQNVANTDPAGRPIGVFDSGLGGLTVVRELAAVLPGEDIVYLGDTARVPYGIKSLETVRRYALQDAAFLRRFDPKLIVVACNTASAAAVEVLEEACPMGVVDVVRPGAAMALRQTDRTIAVIATEATIKSGAYQRAIHAGDPQREVLAVACPLLVLWGERGVVNRLFDPIADWQRVATDVRLIYRRKADDSVEILSLIDREDLDRYVRQAKTR
jgi:glutamate racemase